MIKERLNIDVSRVYFHIMLELNKINEISTTFQILSVKAGIKHSKNASNLALLQAPNQNRPNVHLSDIHA